MFDLSGKIALVTGSVAGLGKAMAMALARQGATVILNGRSDEHLETTQREFSGLGLGVHTACFDTGDLDAATNRLKAIDSDLGAIDILINNVGYTVCGLHQGGSLVPTVPILVPIQTL